ncbi:MAG: adhB [Planctomycetaceae bacterium]|nr:adhB [Planctomycetaceae bacterium]
MSVSPGADSTAHSTLLKGWLEPFDYYPRTRVVFGPGTVHQLGELALEAGAKKVLLVTDRGLRAVGHIDLALKNLAAANLNVTVFDEVRNNPTTLDVERGLALASRNEIDLLIGLGGGSSMDCAKGINFLLTNGGKMEDYWGTGKAKLPMLPMIAVPTTSGTGSEAQSYALIAQSDTHMKMACGDKKAACKVAILDPLLTLSMPPAVTAATGIDALSHALESYVTTRRNPISLLFSHKAWGLLCRAFPIVSRDPRHAAARGAMLLGSHLAGAAIENSMLGATHACANPLSAHYDMIHGVAIGLMLPHVIRYNAPHVGHAYGKLAEVAGLCDAHDPSAAEKLAEYITELVELSGQPTRLRDCGVTAETIPQMAIEATKQWTGTFNPRPVSVAEFEELYTCAW